MNHFAKRPDNHRQDEQRERVGNGYQAKAYSNQQPTERNNRSRGKPASYAAKRQFEEDDAYAIHRDQHTVDGIR